MKKLLALSALVIGLTLSAAAQKPHGNSANAHAQKTHVKKQHLPKAVNSQKAENHAINARHKAAIAAIKANTTLTKEQQKEQIKAANIQHKNEMQTLHKK